MARIEVELPLGALGMAAEGARRMGYERMAAAIQDLMYRYGDLDPQELAQEALQVPLFPVYQHTHFTFDPNLSVLTAKNREILLSGQEQRLMRILTSNPNAIVPIDTLIEVGLDGDRGREMDQVGNHLNQVVAHIRDKLQVLFEGVENAPEPAQILRTYKERGYALVDKPELRRIA